MSNNFGFVAGKRAGTMLSPYVATTLVLLVDRSSWPMGRAVAPDNQRLGCGHLCQQAHGIGTILASAT
jgi:hypothetical protein